jgi:sirohydrochlorin cobaltochelatase
MGLLIVGHGTRDDRGSAEFARLTNAVAAMVPETIVEGCFLELVEPDIPQGIQRAIDRGARRLVVVPLLLVAAGHARRDIPYLLEAAAARFPWLDIRQTRHLGSHPVLLKLARCRYTEALAPRAEVAAKDTLLLVVGRGTKDPDANAELCSFARHRFEQTPVGWQETCFLAITEPSLARALELVRQLPFSRVVIEPHFLFQGELLDRVRQVVAEAAADCPEKEFIVAERLGADELLAEAVIELAGFRPSPTDRTAAGGEDNSFSSKL